MYNGNSSVFSEYLDLSNMFNDNGKNNVVTASLRLETINYEIKGYLQKLVFLHSAYSPLSILCTSTACEIWTLLRQAGLFR